MQDQLLKLITEKYEDIIACASDRLDYSLVNHIIRLVELLDDAVAPLNYRFSMFKNIFIELCASKKKFIYSLQLCRVIKMVHSELMMKPAEFNDLLAVHKPFLRGPNRLFLINAEWERDDVKNIPVRGIYLAYLATLKNDADMARYVLEKYADLDLYGEMYDLASKFDLWDELESAMDRCKYPICEKPAMADTVAIVFGHADRHHSDWLKCAALIDQLKKYGYRIELLTSHDINAHMSKVTKVNIIPKSMYKHNLNGIAKWRYSVIYHLDCGYISKLCSYMTMGIRDIKLQYDEDYKNYVDYCPKVSFDIDMSERHWRAIPFFNIDMQSQRKAKDLLYIVTTQPNPPELLLDSSNKLIYYSHSNNTREENRIVTDLGKRGMSHMFGNKLTYWGVLTSSDVLYTPKPKMTDVFDCLHLEKFLIYDELSDEVNHFIEHLGCGRDFMCKACEFNPDKINVDIDINLKTTLQKLGLEAIDVCKEMCEKLGMKDRSPKMASVKNEPDFEWD
jgi:hypothetical protein